MAKRKLSVLVVDDDAAMRDVLDARLNQWGFRVLLAGDAREAVEVARKERPDLVLTDVVMPEVSGIDLLDDLKGDDPNRPVILLTAHGTVEMAVEAMKRGAVDFLTKPLDYRNLQAVVNQTFRDREILRRSREAIAAEDRAGHDGAVGFGLFVGESPPMLELYDLIRSMAETDAPVLITGESGTGKELAAQTIHQLSARRQGPFVAVNAAAIPRELMESEIFGHERGAFTGATQARPGCFEMADGGTLLLDEIGEMPLELQPKLLRVLDESRFRRVGGKRELVFDVRTLAATNRDPRRSVREGLLREDLYFRLNVFHLAVPPLRDRGDDIRLLASHFAAELAGKHGRAAKAFRDETIDILLRYRWPGNVRELRNVLERAVVLSRDEWIEPSHLPPYVREPDQSRENGAFTFPAGATAADVERELILRTLEETSNNKAEAARRLGLHVKTIRNKLRSYGLDG